MTQIMHVSDEFKRQLAKSERAGEVKLPAQDDKPRLKETVKGLQSSRFLVQTEFEHSETIIEGLLREREMVLFGGPPKVGKSRLSYQMAICLSSGHEFLGMKSLKRKVLYLDLENKPEMAKDRIKLIGHDNANTDNLVLYVPENIAKNQACLNSKGIELLKGMIGTVKPDVLFIDPLRIFGGMKWDERRCEDVIMAYSVISSFFEINPKLSIVIIHHTHKITDHKNAVSLKSDPGAWIQHISGSYALVAHSESIWGFSREISNDGEDMVIFNGMARNWRVPLMLLEDCEDLSYRRLYGEDMALTLMSPREREHWVIARDLKIFKMHQLESACKVPARMLFGMTRKAQSCGVLDYSEGNYLVTAKVTKNIFD